MWSYLAAGVGFAFAAAVQPGPFQAFLIAATLARGWRRTLPAALAPLLSDAPILVIALLALSRLPPHLIRLLHLAGAGFLFFLAAGAWRSWRRFDPQGPPPAAGGGRTLLQAALVNFLNPNPWLGWTLVMGPLFWEGYRRSPAHGIALIAGFYVTMVLCLAGLITLFAAARRFGPRVQRVTLGLSVAALVGFGVYQLWLGLGLGGG